MHPKFNYSSYWRTWNRVLGVLPDGSIAEISVTHINGNWDSVKAENIRTHRTARAPKDIQADMLPAVVLLAMKAMLGEAKVERLLHFDYMANVDWELHAMVNNGGVPFESCKKGTTVVAPRLIRSKVLP